jgi:cytidine deaminase
VAELIHAAKVARDHSYSPYSGCKVGAAFRTTDGKIHTGCNVENSSYGATCCAERVAIQAGVAAQGRLEIAEMAIVTDASPPWPPCGVCRQVIAEFAAPSLLIHASNLHGEVKTTPFTELLPQAFGPGHLKK